jgi:ribose transport system ATP-binding protein
MDEPQNMLEMRRIEKQFNGNPVLKKTHFNLRKGEVHALMGGNGAGKSTLMKILTGVYTADAGDILIDGQKVEITDPNAAEALGVAMIFQEFSLVPTLTVAQNIYLHREPRRAAGLLIDDAETARRARAILEELGEDIDPQTPVERLSVGMCQIVEIAKALSKNARILIMDEPTSSISEAEVERLFIFVRKLKANGISIIYISHRMSEIFTLCDRVTVMRDGEVVLTQPCGQLTMETLIDAMLGGSAGASMHWHERSHSLGAEPALELVDLAREGHFENVNLRVYPGEIVGLAGLMGSGRTEIMEAIFGLHPTSHGEVRVRGRVVSGIRQAIEAGVALVPENRRTQGLVLSHSVLDNFILPNLKRFRHGFWMRLPTALDAVRRSIAALSIKTDHPFKTVGLLSGGNQQKVVLGKWLTRSPQVLLLDEPTIGVDIGAKSDIVKLVRQLASQGTAILVVSSEFEELLAMSDRLVVLCNGRVTQRLDRREIESEEMLHHAVQA